jgi:hypothetical protein
MISASSRRAGKSMVRKVLRLRIHAGSSANLPVWPSCEWATGSKALTAAAVRQRPQTPISKLVAAIIGGHKTKSRSDDDLELCRQSA